MESPNIREEMDAARAAFRDKQFELALGRYRILAERSQPECQVFLAWMLTEGIGCQKNEREAALFYERAAALGNPVGCFYFGRWLTRIGRHEQALSLYRRAADAGYLPAIVRVGYSLMRGKGATVNLRQGYEFLVAAARRGHVFALRELAVQDWRGGRGLMWRSAAPIEFLVALIGGIAISIVDKDSDRLRA